MKRIFPGKLLLFYQHFLNNLHLGVSDRVTGCLFLFSLPVSSISLRSTLNLGLFVFIINPLVINKDEKDGPGVLRSEKWKRRTE
jgi:hypothetical protein